MKDSDEARLLAIILAAGAAAHLAQRRLFDSLVPNRLAPFRREIEVGASCWQLAGAAALCAPRLSQPARWVNLPLHVGALLGTVDVWRHPRRFPGRRGRAPEVQSFVSAVRIPVHLAVVALVFWVTRSRSSRPPSRAARGQVADRGEGSAAPDPIIDDGESESAAPAAEE